MPNLTRRALSTVLLSLPLLIAACGQQPQKPTPVDTSVAPSDAQVNAYTPQAHNHNHELNLASPALDPSVERTRQAQLGIGRIPPSSHPIRTLSLPTNAQTSKVALRILVLSSGAGDYGLDSARLMLNRAGIPYDVLDASTQALSSSTLIDASGVGRYSGVVLTDNALVTQTSPGVFQSALDAGEWSLLFEYEKAYAVRQLALYGYPGVAPEDYGLRAVSGAEGSSTQFHVTDAGKSIFTDLTANDVPVRYAYSYPSQLEPASGVTTQPVLQDGSGRILAVTSQTDGRERLLVTTAQNPYLLHTELMSYGLINWLTKGVYLGEYRRFLQVDIDDWFLPGDHYDAATGGFYPTPFRLSAQDAVATRDDQTALQSAFPVAKSFRYAVAFNGFGADLKAQASCDPNVKSSDPLTSVSRCMNNSFDWINHTYTHLRLDITDFFTSYAEIRKNVLVGKQLGLNMNSVSLITGEHSGLGYKDPNETDPDGNVGAKIDFGLGASNVNMLAAALLNGVSYIASNHSVSSQWDPSCTGCGVVHPLTKALFLVPRYPNSIGYYVTTPDEAVAAYNRIYAPGGTMPYYDHALSYSEFLDKDSDISLGHVLAGEAFPTYMHQPNLNQYAPGHSLAGDWLRAVLTKYSRYSTLPLKTLRWDALGAYVRNRTLSMKSGTTAVWDRSTNTVTVRNPVGGPVYVTGGAASIEETYAGQNISRLTTAAGVNVQLKVQPR
ncbi:hypothetical protein [Deinococcus sonorensis]|uniref:Agd3 CBM87 domain-containing protein n=2 Tax=Deinococcus sonorensis TaxID=309891 RepID=A0AAU7UCM7_9DEIO